MPSDHTAWTCADTENRLTDFLEAALAPEELAAFEQHRATCADCTALTARVGATLDTLHGMALLEEPPELVRAILDRTIGAREVAPVSVAQPADEPRGWFDWLSALMQPQFAYGALAVLASALVVSHALGIQWRRPTIAELEPDNIYRAANRSGHLVYARGTKFVEDSRFVYDIQSAFETEPAAESTPQPKPATQPAPGQTQSTPTTGPHDSTRAIRPVYSRRRVTEAASLILGIRPRSQS